MSTNTVNGALRRLALACDVICGRGFRAMAHTIINEALNVPAHLLEHHLAHKVKNPLGRAYSRTSHVPKR